MQYYDGLKIPSAAKFTSDKKIPNGEKVMRLFRQTWIIGGTRSVASATATTERGPPPTKTDVLRKKHLGVLKSGVAFDNSTIFHMKSKIMY